jgi:teichoic acid glycerol-phosphate primase
MSKIRHIYRFFGLCKTADYVFLDDTYLPVSYALKYRWLFRPRVVQLWHSAGLFKRVGLDITSNWLDSFLMRLNFRNFDLVIVSAEHCRAPIAGFMGVDTAKVIALGTSYTDRYVASDTDRNRAPRGAGKKTVAYAPTFRGDAHKVKPSPAPSVATVFAKLEPGFECYISTHPQEDFVSEEFKPQFKLSDALSEIDVLITDYSSIAMDYMLANPQGELVLYVPDYGDYASSVGFYVPLEEVSENVAFNEADLIRILSSDLSGGFAAYQKNYLNRCDGKATDRLLEYLEIT